MAYSPNLFTDFLTALDVPCTPCYSARRFAGMPFQNLFGLMRLLREYGVDSEAYRLDDKSKIACLTPPFLADTAKGFVIVDKVDLDAGKISYTSEGTAETADAAGFLKAWNGVVLLAYPDAKACEPSYRAHARMEFLEKAKKWVLAAVMIVLAAYAVVANRIYAHVSSLLVIALDCIGLYFSFLLVQKSLKIHNPHADRVCGVLQKEGCDHVLETPAAKFFGLFGWSEVGLAYFSVSLLALLMFPRCTGSLALINLCCLPFSFWSIWYQKYRAKAWCTLCVSVQCVLWLLFGCYLCGGWIGKGFPLSPDIAVLGLCYAAVLLLTNALSPYLGKPSNKI